MDLFTLFFDYFRILASIFGLGFLAAYFIMDNYLNKNRNGIESKENPRTFFPLYWGG